MRLRRAVVADAPEVAVLFRRVRTACLAYLPTLHTPEEDRAFFSAVLAEQIVHLAEDGDQLIGFSAGAPGWLNHLYVDPSWHGRGAADALLQAAVPPGAVRLWCFQRNARARAFYERRGFRYGTVTDGSGNEEREPDVLYLRPA